MDAGGAARSTSRSELRTSITDPREFSEAPTLSLVRPRTEPEPEPELELELESEPESELELELELVDEPKKVGRETSVVVPHEGSVAIACGPGVLMLRWIGAGRAKIEYDSAELDVFLQVDDMIELDDGALIGAGKRWFRFERGTDKRRARLKMLDVDGVPMVVMALSEGVYTIGRQIGDLILPAERELAALHFQLVLRGDFVFLRSLADAGHTWLILSPGETVPITGTLVAEHRLLQLRSPSGRPGRLLETDESRSILSRRTRSLSPASESDVHSAPAATSLQRKAARSG